MKTHTNNFKVEIAKMGRQVTGKIYHYFNYVVNAETNDKIITENNSYLILENYNKNDKEELTNENIYSMKLIKNGELLQSLMKQFNFEAKYDLRIGDVINPHFGLLVNDEYEFLDYGDYIIYSKQYNANNDTWDYVCYDLMLYSMIQYNGLNISYPITVKNYINAIANKMGVGFANINDAFTNSDELIYKDLFKDKNKTYRDILDKLAEITASNILINDNNELEVYYPKYAGEMADMSNSSIEITNSEKAELQKFELEGKTTQATRSGKNLLRNDLTSRTANGLTAVVNNDKSVTISGTATATTIFNVLPEGATNYNLPAGTYILSGCPKNGNPGTYKLDINVGTYYQDVGNGVSFTLANETKIVYSRILIYSGQSVNFTYYPMIRLSSVSDNAYEPYGVMPSPDYPSELVSVGYENLLKEEYEQGSGVNNVNTRIRAKNLVKITKGKKYTLNMFGENASNYNYIINTSSTQSTLPFTNGYYDCGNSVTWQGASPISFTATKDGWLAVIIKYPNDGVITPSDFTNVNLILTDDGMQHSYIPYGKYGIEVKTIGKNLLDVSNIETGTKNGITCSLEENGIKLSGTATRYTAFEIPFNTVSGINTLSCDNWGGFTLYPQYNNVGLSGASSNKTYSQNINKIVIGINNGVSIDKTINIQIEKGTQSTTYEEYKSNTYLYTLDNPLRSIGNTKDLLYIKNGMLYVERKIGSKVLNGSESWVNWAFTSDEYIGFLLDNYIDYDNSTGTDIRGMANYFEVTVGGNINKDNLGMRQIGDNLKRIYVCISKDLITSIANFKTWLSTHNTEVQYILAKSYTEELGQVDMPSTYEGITYIETTDSNEPTINVSYISEFEEIDEEYLKDVNVNFGERFGQINRVVLRDTENKIEYVAQDNISIEKNKLTQINIIDNPITLNGNEDNICQNILNKLNGLYYSINDFTTIGLCYYDFLDIFFVKIKDTRYQCLLLNNEITITQGIEETIFADTKSNSQVEGGNYETNYLTNKDIQTKITQLNDTKVESKSVINSINDSKEKVVISAEKIMYIKDFIGTTDANGFLDIELNSDFVVCSATANFNSNDYGFVIPYYDYNNGNTKWKLKIKDKNDVAVANTQIATTIYYFKKGRND